MNASQAHSILNRVIGLNGSRLDPAAACAFLKCEFSDADHRRMDELETKARVGPLSSEDSAELEQFYVVADLLAALHFRARESLQPGTKLAGA